MNNSCKGNGECLVQSFENDYIKRNDIICNHSCVPLKCKNYILCGSKCPEMYVGSWGGKGLCMSCHESFGTWGVMPKGNIGKGILEITNNIECPICLEEKECISQPYCNHSLCVECFKECYGYNWEYDVPRPKFPYSEDIELEYEDYNTREEIEIFENKYPLMKKYHEEYDKWHDDKIIAYRKIKHIFCICPLCRITKEIKYNQILEYNIIYKKCFNILKKNWLMKKYGDNN
jgi:hypothetical protein